MTGLPRGWIVVDGVPFAPEDLDRMRAVEAAGHRMDVMLGSPFRSYATMRSPAITRDDHLVWASYAVAFALAHPADPEEPE